MATSMEKIFLRIFKREFYTDKIVQHEVGIDLRTQSNVIKTQFDYFNQKKQKRRGRINQTSNKMNSSNPSNLWNFSSLS